MHVVERRRTPRTAARRPARSRPGSGCEISLRKFIEFSARSVERTVQRRSASRSAIRSLPVTRSRDRRPGPRSPPAASHRAVPGEQRRAPRPRRTGGECPQQRSPDQYGGRAERERAQYVGAARESHCPAAPGHPLPTASTNGGEGIDRGRRAVELPTTVVRHHHAVGPDVDRTHSVTRDRESLDQQGKLGPRPQPLEVAPGHRGIEGGTRCAQPPPRRPGAPTCASCPCSTRLAATDLSRQREGVPHVAQPTPHHRNIDRHHQRTAAGRLGPIDQRSTSVSVAQPVQLEPRRRRPRRSSPAAHCSTC